MPSANADGNGNNGNMIWSMFNGSLSLGNVGKRKCMPVLPKLVKRGVFGKNAILETSLKTRNCGFVVVPSVSDGGFKPSL